MGTRGVPALPGRTCVGTLTRVMTASSGRCAGVDVFDFFEGMLDVVRWLV